MEAFEINLGRINGVIKVRVHRKDIKNVHLKVYRSLDVVLSAPNKISDEWVKQFLDSHKTWIDKQITMYKKSSGFNALAAIKNGSSTQLLGKDMRILILASLTNHVEVDEKRICIFANDKSDVFQAQREFDKWWRQLAKKTFEAEIDSLYEKIFRKYGIEKPVLSIKRMKTLWGSCTHDKNKITINVYLLKASIRCIQYVVLHELTHLLYPNHDADFYNFLTVHMPDWKERKKQLDTEVVQGL